MSKAKLAKKAKAERKTIIPGIPDVWLYVVIGVILMAAVLALATIQPKAPAATATPLVTLAAQLPTVTLESSAAQPTAITVPTATAQPTPVPVPTTAEQTRRPLANVPAVQRNDYFKNLPAMSIDTNKKYQATIVTDRGNIVVDLNAAKAPVTVNNFVSLARQGFYDGLTFHRVEPGFVIQGGDPAATGSGGPGYTVLAEIGLPHTDGAIAMARRPDNVNSTRASSGSQFYITLGAQAGLDNQYTVFGQVISGLDVTRQIQIGDVIRRVDITEQ